MNRKPKWQYRFNNYKRAFTLLREATERESEHALSDLELEGMIQRFEYTWELAWKTLKDYLENEGVILDKITPKAVLIKSIEAKITTDRETWMQALDDRNQMSHVYDHASFKQVCDNIEQKYLAIFDTLYQKLLEQLMNDEC